VKLDLVNHIFGTDVILNGVSRGEQASIIISQGGAHPADPRSSVPTNREVDVFMTSLGFEPVTDEPFEWIKRVEAIRVSDARPDNFIKSHHFIVPIDLIVAYEDEIS